MDALGQLTGGVAHDFNNLLTVVSGHIPTIKASVSADPGAMRALEAIERAANRGEALTRQLLTFSRRQTFNPTAFQLADRVEAFRAMLASSIGGAVTLVTTIGPEIWPVKVDANEFELALVNLALNARDAMPDGGTLTISTSRIDIDHEPKTDDDLKPGSYAVLALEDTGTGMPPEVAAKVFEPFFTTKQPGRGSGLGLSIVHGFAAQTGGSVQIISAPGEGTTVDLWLPRSECQVIKLDDKEQEPGRFRVRPSEARILVCDDDTDVLTLVATSLRDSGHTVWDADNPSDALEIFERERPIDLLLVDYAMPGMNGIGVINHARGSQPELKVLLMSGHADILHGGGGSGIPLLAKPFKLTELTGRIAALLSEREIPAAADKSRSQLIAASD
jgi:CheY-like chemotaxis protein/two-component sensor histidine kinase